MTQGDETTVRLKRVRLMAMEVARHLYAVRPQAAIGGVRVLVNGSVELSVAVRDTKLWDASNPILEVSVPATVLDEVNERGIGLEAKRTLRNAALLALGSTPDKVRMCPTCLRPYEAGA